MVVIINFSTVRFDFFLSGNPAQGFYYYWRWDGVKTEPDWFIQSFINAYTFGKISSAGSQKPSLRCVKLNDYMG